MSKPPALCTHGSPAKYAFVVDLNLKEQDGFGDIEGPISIQHLDAVRVMFDEIAGGSDTPDRYRIGYVHADRCRTEEL